MQGEQWGGTANQSSSCPARGSLRTASPGQKGVLWMPERVGKVGRGSGALPPRAWWEPELGAAGHCCLVQLHGPGVHVAAHAGLCTGVGRQRTGQTHGAPGSSAGGGPGQSGLGGHLSKATRKLPGSNENMSFRLKAAGEQELKICNRNGGYPAGAGEAGGQGAQSSRGWRDRGGGA